MNIEQFDAAMTDIGQNLIAEAAMPAERKLPILRKKTVGAISIAACATCAAVICGAFAVMQKPEAPSVSSELPALSADTETQTTTTTAADISAVTTQAAVYVADETLPSQPAQTDEILADANESAANTESAQTIVTTSAAQSTMAESTKSTAGSTDALTSAATTSAAQDGEMMWWCIRSSYLEWNGKQYYASDTPNVRRYTQDKYLGKASDFSGVYADDGWYLLGSSDEIYTVKETDTLLFAVKPSGKIVPLVCGWSIEEFEPERLQPDYIDPDAPADPEQYHSFVIY